LQECCLVEFRKYSVVPGFGGIGILEINILPGSFSINEEAEKQVSSSNTQWSSPKKVSESNFSKNIMLAALIRNDYPSDPALFDP